MKIKISGVLKGFSFFFVFILVNFAKGFAAPQISLSDSSISTETQMIPPRNSPEFLSYPSQGLPTEKKFAKEDEKKHSIELPEEENPIKIYVSFMLNEIFKIDEKMDSFEADIDLQLRWHDYSAVFDPKVIGTYREVACFEKAKERLSKIWNPDVKITNLSGSPNVEEPCLIIDADGTVTYVQRVRALFDSKMKLEAFPFDTQTLEVRLTSKRYDTDEIEFVLDQEGIYHSGIREGVTYSGWNLEKVQFIPTIVRGLEGHYFPVFEIQVVIKRNPYSHLFAFGPLILIVIVPTILTLFSFRLYDRIDVPKLLGAWSSAILALIALSFSLTLRYPALGSDSLLSRLIAIIFGYEFLMICLTVTVFNPKLTSHTKSPLLMNEIIKFLRWSIPIAVIIVIGVTILLTMLSA